MICKKCGKTMKDNSKFCLYCGQKMEGQAAEMPPAENHAGNINDSGGNHEGDANDLGRNRAENADARKARQKKRTVPIAAASVMIVLAIAVGGIFGIKALSSPDGAKTDAPAVSSAPKNDVLSPTEGGRAEGNKPSQTPNEKEQGGTAASQAAADELFGYIEQSEEVLLEAYGHLNDEEDTPEGFRRQADILGKLFSDLSEMQQCADAVSGIDANLKNAGKEYFNMLCDSQKAYFELWSFMSDYLDLYVDILAVRPTLEDYFNKPYDYYNTIYAWFLDAKEGYSAIDSCPSCLEGAWEKYGGILDLYENIAYKLYEAEQYYDRLRLLSAMYLADRFEAMDELQFDELSNYIDGAEEHVWRQIEAASLLAEEIRAYIKMEEAKRSGYEFEHIRTGEIYLSYDTVDTIYPSLYNSYDAFVVIKTGCISGNKKILAEVEIEGFTQNYKESFILDSAYETIYIKPPALTGDLNLSSSKSAQLRVTISEQDGTWIDEKTFPVTLKSKYDFELYNDEYGIATRDNLLCFLTPESSAISQLARQAIDEISSMTGGKLASFVGYQETGWNHYVGTYLQAAGIMRALNIMGVRYSNDAFSLSDNSQHILFPEDVLREKSGLCIETALTVASALQRAGMHAFLLLPPGHAQVAVEIWNGTGDDMTGTGEYFLIETTLLSDAENYQNIFVNDANALVGGIEDGVLNESPITYLSEQGWYQYISRYDPYIIDCDDSKVLGLTPFVN